jgi:pimeloyl-ACP methyl ester carboxylesterase
MILYIRRHDTKGIGLASWFWEKLMDEFQNSNSPSIYAINLIGCGISEQSDPWRIDGGSNSSTPQMMPIPDLWVEQCEAFINDVVLKSETKPSFMGNLFGKRKKLSKGVSIMTQGGLAPIGISLAARNPGRIQSLILSSPPLLEELMNGLPEQEIRKNFDFFASQFGNVAFRLLETKPAVRFFSDLFLFENKCDEMWLRKALYEACSKARPPIAAFNSGLCLKTGYREEIASIRAPVLILQGRTDSRSKKRLEDSPSSFATCQIEEIEGKNVLGWESPQPCCRAIESFWRRQQIK